MLPLHNDLPFQALIVTCTIYVLNVQRPCNERDVIIPIGHYGLLMPGGHYRWTLSRFNAEKIRHYFLI